MEQVLLTSVKEIANLGAVASLLVLAVYGLYRGILYLLAFNKDRLVQVESLNKTSNDQLNNIHAQYSAQITAIHSDYNSRLDRLAEEFSKERSDLIATWSIERKEYLVTLTDLKATVQKMFDMVEKRDGDVTRWKDTK